MSFSGDVKRELAGRTGGPRHCRLAELAALVIFCGSAGPDGLVFRTDRDYINEAYCTLVRGVFRAEPDQITTDFRKKCQLHECFSVISDSDLCSGILETLFGGKENPAGMTLSDLQKGILGKNCCRRAFLRGAFLAAGSVSDPERSYHFEIICQTRQLAGELCDLIGGLGVKARVVVRRKSFVVYVKESSAISDLLGLMQADVSMLRFESVRVVRDVRGNVNRKVNCETANISKTAKAAARQIEDIELIEKTIGFSKLPDRLDEVAQIRLQYPAATFAEIGRMLDPPVGKSGVNHRLRRLGEIAEDLRKKQGGSFQDG